MTIETDEEFIGKITSEYSKYINETPALLSLLYDIDLLPEQCRHTNLPVNAVRMAAVCDLFKRIPIESSN